MAMLQRRKDGRQGGRERSKFNRDGRGPRDRTRSTELMMVKKRSHFLEGIKKIASDDYELLRKFVTEHGKIIPSRLTGATAKQQRRIKRAVQRARVMGVLP